MCPNTIGRPRSFDERQVLDQVRETFWAKGYDGTSLNDICAATGLLRGSLYQAFGDKKQLFIASFRDYMQQMAGMFMGIVDAAPSPFEGIRLAVHAVIDHGRDSETCSRGCMIVNSLIELGEDPEIGPLVREFDAQRLRIFSGYIRQAQETGEIEDRREPERIARLIKTFTMGLSTSMKGGMSLDDAKSMIDDLFDSLRGPVGRTA